MTSKDKRDRAWVLDTAKAVAAKLQLRSDGTRIRVHPPGKILTIKTTTDGWEAEIGNLGRKQPILEIWLDRFSGHAERKLYACFWRQEPKQIEALSRKVSKRLWPVRRVKQGDTVKRGFYALKEKLSHAEFNAPILENYDGYRSHFFGFYDRTRAARSKINAGFCERAVEFFVDVARSLPGAKEEDVQREVYPRCENRKMVKAHLGRERSGYLAAQCKERDGHLCRVCKMSFADEYGEELGAAFAEAHHLIPLGQQKDKVRTELNDLITVCANCHRMLHRMEGKTGDVAKLRAIVRRNRA